MSKTKPLSKALRAASSPEARKKAVATMKRRREEREAAIARGAAHEAHMQSATQEMSLDDIPDGKVKKKYAKKAGHTVTEKEWMFLQVAKLLLKE